MLEPLPQRIGSGARRAPAHPKIVPFCGPVLESQKVEWALKSVSSRALRARSVSCRPRCLRGVISSFFRGDVDPAHVLLLKLVL